jgi:hypothetical protein
MPLRKRAILIFAEAKCSLAFGRKLILEHSIFKTELKEGIYVLTKKNKAVRNIPHMTAIMYK